MLLPADVPVLDIQAVAMGLGVDLQAAFARLAALYGELDARLAERPADLALPCRRGCDMCCHESVFLTPLEFLYAWDHLQRHASDAERAQVVHDGQQLYLRHRDLIDSFDAPPPAGQADHFAQARRLRYRCPLLAQDGACRVHPAREMAARLFGSSFQAPGELYACHLVGAHLAERTVTLPLARTQLATLRDLPLTHYRQVYPYYIALFYPLAGEAPLHSP